MILIDIIIQLIIFTLSATVIALPTAGIMFWRSKKQKKRNTILTFLSPFVFIYTFYFGYLIGGFTCSSVFNTGCGMDGYYHTDLPNGYEIESIVDDFDREYFTGNISKEGKKIVEWVKKIKIIGDTIYGERYYINEAPGSEYYFSLNTQTNELTQYTSYDEAQKLNPVTTTTLTPLEAFYYKSWQWIIPLTVLVFITSSGIVFLIWFITMKIHRILKRRTKYISL
ncbi:hypothetical protein [uncultured Bacteroides sp.]|uniref:hypothetical protein n=1 Tax=uncultured Bacteroides sp. TaxID=162156 RepID=UPI0025FE707B|nr:hypothetical protein [uncultured Bacteroides sp.]